MDISITRFNLKNFRELIPLLMRCFPDFWEPRLAEGKYSFPYDLKLFTARLEGRINSCNSESGVAKTFSGDFEPLQNYFRFRGIRTFLLGGSGFAMWALNSWRGNDYRSSENRPNHGSFLIHHGDSRGFVPTFRLEAYREGIEDLYYLQLAAKSNDPAVKALIAPQKLKELMSQGTPAATAVWHTALLKALAAQQSQ